MRILFILGAGASYGSVDCAPKPPPLGPDLYDALCAHAPAFAVNTNDFSSIFKKNFEEGMDAFVLNGSGFTPFITERPSPARRGVQEGSIRNRPSSSTGSPSCSLMYSLIMSSVMVPEVTAK